MKEDTILDLRQFEEDLFQLIENYLEENKSISDESVLVVNPKTKEIEIIKKTDQKVFDQYDLKSLVRFDDDNNIEPDCDAINSIATKYIFVR